MTTTTETKRPVVQELENILQDKEFKVLDHGFVRVVDYMGNDNAVVQAARVSYGKGTKTVSQDIGLINYLMKNQHHCYHPDMLVLTLDGWKNWSDCQEYETYVVPDPTTKTYRTEILQLKSFDVVDEEMYTFKSSRMSYCVTKNHTMWFKGQYDDTFNKIKVQDKPDLGWFEPLSEYKILDGNVRILESKSEYHGRVQYTGKVYCTTTSNGLLAVRGSNGEYGFICGNSPFEMCEIKFHIKLPIFVARQWIRHRCANVNEYSARYSILEKEFYIPNPEDINLQSKNNKQGRGNTVGNTQNIIDMLVNDSLQCYDSYEEMLDNGIAREIARMILPVNYYTQWYWKIDLRNLLHFIELRKDTHAQLEIRKYAEILSDITRLWVPHSYNAFEINVLNTITIPLSTYEKLKKYYDDSNNKLEILD